MAGGVQGLDSPTSPEMGPAEGTLVLPLTHQTQTLVREWGHPKALSGCIPDVG